MICDVGSSARPRGTRAGGRVREIARVQLPGMPILGEGKPENQNLALPFTTGERVFMVDMNQVTACHCPSLLCVCVPGSLHH